MIERRTEDLNELIALVVKFIDFAGDLKKEGKITDEQYKEMTKSKLTFLNSVQCIPVAKAEAYANNLFL